jgi:hypothetical protein
VGGLEILLQAALAEAAEDGEVVHLVARQHAAGVIALVDQHRGAVDDVVGVARFVVDALEHLEARAVVRAEAEVVAFVVPRLDQVSRGAVAAVGVVLVRGKPDQPPAPTVKSSETRSRPTRS